MNYHVANRESPLTLASLQGDGGGHVQIVPIKSFKVILARSIFFKI